MHESINIIDYVEQDENLPLAELGTVEEIIFEGMNNDEDMSEDYDDDQDENNVSAVVNVSEAGATLTLYLPTIH